MTPRRPSYAILLMIIGTLCLATGWAFVKVQGERIPLFEITFFRGLAGFIILYPIARTRTASFRGRNRLMLTVRCAFGFISMCAAFYAMTRLPLGDVSLLLNTSPLFVALLAPFLLKERSTWATFAYAALAFVGVGLVLKPSVRIVESAALAALAAGVLVAFVIITIRHLHATDDTWVITMWFTVFVLVASALPAALNFVVPDGHDIVLIAVTGIALTLSQIFMTKAYQYADASTVAPFSYLSVLYSYGFDMVLWGRIPDGWSIAGSALAIAAGIALVVTHRRTAAASAEAG